MVGQLRTNKNSGWVEIENFDLIFSKNPLQPLLKIYREGNTWKQPKNLRTASDMVYNTNNQENTLIKYVRNPVRSCPKLSETAQKIFLVRTASDIKRGVFGCFLVLTYWLGGMSEMSEIKTAFFAKTF